MNLEELNNRLETLEAIEAITKLKARYCQCADERDAEGYANLFTEPAKPEIVGYKEGYYESYY